MTQLDADFVAQRWVGGSGKAVFSSGPELSQCNEYFYHLLDTQERGSSMKMICEWRPRNACMDGVLNLLGAVAQGNIPA